MEPHFKRGQEPPRSITFPKVNDELGKQVLKGVSRSFYLTLRLLPAPMRDAASLGYLLARTSDTIADTAGISTGLRIETLAQFAAAVETGHPINSWPAELLENAEPKEKILLQHSDEIFDWLNRISPEEADLIREVVRIIISGQTLDLQRFANASVAHPISLIDDATLDDYAWRVAGCVGAFWTKLGFLTLGDRYSTQSPAVLLDQGIAYGKGLQLVNILRDLPRDLANGRCYLPVNDPNQPDELMAAFHRWLPLADRWILDGKAYAGTLKSRRLRASTALPALIAEETLERLHHAGWKDLQGRIKVPRQRIYALIIKAFLQ
jgi:farnesyl-diphosphate farnesyltransferase